nr:hypothetical protein CFP56_54238 [Quercus suber]
MVEDLTRLCMKVDAPIELVRKALKMAGFTNNMGQLVITSGSKMLTMDFENWVLKYLEGRLVLRVDKMKTAIHSVVSENISYLRMELQAVPPSVLHPPMTEKILGMKILQHVFKKLKQSDGFKFDFQIENEVREIFRTWD